MNSGERREAADGEREGLTPKFKDTAVLCRSVCYRQTVKQCGKVWSFVRQVTRQGTACNFVSAAVLRG